MPYVEEIGFIGHQDDWQGPIRMGAGNKLVELANEIKASAVSNGIDHKYGVRPLNGARYLVSAAQSISVHLKKKYRHLSVMQYVWLVYKFTCITE